MTDKKSNGYFDDHPEHLKILKINETPFGLFTKKGLWEQAFLNSLEIERFSHLGFFREAVWVKEDRTMNEWKFTDTFRVKK